MGENVVARPGAQLSYSRSLARRNGRLRRPSEPEAQSIGPLTYRRMLNIFQQVDLTKNFYFS